MDTLLDVIAGATALYGSACVYLRADALKPCRRAYPDGPPWVVWALIAKSIMLAAYAAPVAAGSYQATETEAVVFTVLAAEAHILWRNMRRQAKKRAGEAG